MAFNEGSLPRVVYMDSPIGIEKTKESEKQNSFFLRYLTTIFAFIFILIAISLAIVLAMAAHDFLNQPESIAGLMDYANAQGTLFVRVIYDERISSLELSSIFTLAIVVIAMCSILKVIISFMSTCVEAGRHLINISQNFD